MGPPLRQDTRPGGAGSTPPSGCSIGDACESWHNNHHAFPGSAKLGLFPGETDLGWWLIMTFKGLGLARNIVTPDLLPQRAELRALAEQGHGCPMCRRLRLAFG